LGPVGQALNGCLSMNFKLVGVVASFDAATRVGRATLAGVRQQAA